MEGKRKSVIVRIAGAAGDGIASSGEIFGKMCSRQGLHVMAYNSFQSAIRGGHVWLQLNVGSEKTLSQGEQPDVAILLNRTSPDVHIPQIRKGGVVFYNSSIITQDLTKMRPDIHYYSFPFRELVNEPGVDSIMANVMLLGCVVQLIGIDSQAGLDFISDRYGKKGEQVVKLNQKVFQMGIDWAEKNVHRENYHIEGDGKQRMFISGNSAMGMGLLAHGIKLYAAYPMSPSTGILHYLAKKAKSHKIVVKQTEDEIASVNFIIGAAQAGVRAATATSGGGFALMTEGIGLAGMLEVPIVVINVQRGGPSTGIPTKHEQGDLNQILAAGQSDIPRVVLAPKDIKEAYEMTGRAFNLAEKYQIPVMILSDFYIAEHFETVEPIETAVPIDRGKLIHSFEGEYKRYLTTEDGVSPRLQPGVPGGMYVSASDEHDEKGIVISDVLAGLPSALEVRNIIHDKRMRKLEMARRDDMRLPMMEGPKNAAVTLVTWGSTFLPAKEALPLLQARGINANILNFTDLFPMPKEGILQILKKCKNIVAIEANYSSQLVRLIRAETGFDIKTTINRYDGDPFSGEDICNRVTKTLKPQGIQDKELAHV